jgi:hypothetical protein
MRKFVFISGALFSSSTLLSILFKLMHWPGATILLILGLAGLALLFIPFYAFYQYNKGK